MYGRKRLESDFKVIRRLGLGAEGFVCLATKRSECETEAQLNDESRGYALKLIRFSDASPQIVDDLQEAKILANIDNEYILRYYDSFREDKIDGDKLCSILFAARFKQLSKLENPTHYDGYLFIQTQLCISTLEAVMGRPTEENHLQLMKKYFFQICSGMSAAHSKNIVHNDLKPNNIFLLENDEPIDETDNYKAVVGDFGFGFGTRSFMSPEQSKASQAIETVYMTYEEVRSTIRSISTASDVYALGLVYAQMILGLRQPQIASVFEQIKIPQKPEWIEVAEWNIISRMTQAAREERITLADLLELDYFEEFR